MSRHYINTENKSYVSTYCYVAINTWFAEYFYFEENRWITNREVNNLHFPDEETLTKFMGNSYKEVDLEGLNDFRRSCRMMSELVS